MLDVSWNGFEDHGSELIASATAVNDVIVDLNLSANRIGAKGLGLVLKALSSSKSIKSLNVRMKDSVILINMNIKLCRQSIHQSISVFRLQITQVSRNPITFEGPVVAVQTILEHPECGLESIEFRVSSGLLSPSTIRICTIKHKLIL